MGSLLTYERLHADRAGESHSARLDVSLSTRHFAPPAPPFGVSELTPRLPQRMPARAGRICRRSASLTPAQVDFLSQR